MCGIAGIYRYDSKADVSPEVLRRMVVAQKHRGPDEVGFYLNDEIGLGHARLSIVDLAGGIQPIHNEDQTLWIIYNGEVYNYPELRADLLKRGHQFYTTTDTEVILHLYEDRGPACVEELNGQFVFAIWDEKRRELFIARDRVGVRPLHYVCQNGSMIFASEIKSILATGEVSRELNPESLDQIFTFWTTLPGYTVFKGVNELPPGHYMKASKGRIVVERYWSPPFADRDNQLNCPVGEIREQIRELLLDAVRIRLRADVTVGAYLSGGLDSSAVTALIAKNFDQSVQTFGVRFAEKAFDESRYQDEMAEYLGIEQKSLVADNEQIGAVFPEVVRHCEKPVLRTAPAPLYLLSGLVRSNGIKVVLTGEGADEVFGGYNIFREAKVRRFMSRQPESASRSTLINQLYGYIFNTPRAKMTMGGFFGQNLERSEHPLFSHLLRWETTSRIKTFFSEALKAEIGQNQGVEQILKYLPPEFARWDYLSKAQYLEITLFLSNYLLSSQGDRVAMANSIEIRLPYLDTRVIELMGRVPAKWKILGMNEKHLLKSVFCDVLPKNITERTKHPYRAPIKASLMNDGSREYVDELLSERSLLKTGIFDVRKVRMLVEKLKKDGPVGEFDNMALAGIISTQLIYHYYIENYILPKDDLNIPKLVVDRRSKKDISKKKMPSNSLN